MKTYQEDNRLMNLLSSHGTQVTEVSRVICDTNMGTLKLRLRKGEQVYRFLLDAVELPKELNKELFELLYPPTPTIPDGKQGWPPVKEIMDGKLVLIKADDLKAITQEVTGISNTKLNPFVPDSVFTKIESKLKVGRPHGSKNKLKVTKQNEPIKPQPKNV